MYFNIEFCLQKEIFFESIYYDDNDGTFNLKSSIALVIKVISNNTENVIWELYYLFL